LAQENAPVTAEFRVPVRQKARDLGGTFRQRLRLAVLLTRAAMIERDMLADGAPASASVLLVEDEALIRTVVAEGLRDEGFTVIEAANAAEALAVLASGLPVDLLFTDVRMPGTMDGLALARVVMRTRPDIGILVTSGHHVDRPDGFSEPILPKPYLIPEAVRRVRRILEAAR
jgi:CheY-like chemotaxis protein